MFEALKTKLESALSRLRGKGKLSEADVDLALREIRKSLLEADVDFKVVRELVERIRERAVQLDVLESISAAQHISTVVYEELIALMGDPAPLAIAPKPPTVVLMVGLQGSGKTTTTVKLARRLKDSHSPLVVACDLRRPAAVDQLRVLAEQSKVAFFGPEKGEQDVLKVVRGAAQYAASRLHDVILLDTAGRLHVDPELMEELSSVAGTLPPHEKLLVVDAMMGQEAVNVARSFHELLSLTGLVLTKLDGDARGGGALAIRAATGVPVKFAGVGEGTDALEVFDSRRMASRIMGMGDIQGLLEKVQAAGAEDTARIAESIKGKAFTLETLLLQFQQIEKMGPLGKVMEMIPGVGRIKGLDASQMDDSILRRNKAIIQSMTRAERLNPRIIKGSRRRRIALGSGTSVQMVNQLLAQYEQMKKLFKTFSSGGKGPNLRSLFGRSGRFF
ncbi:signal recognition particle protein [Fretibacterium sp. OH1220_COT-178]|uniref:signal recognition particle protein n=1 Tax=Fretibacterium sp. OH1220_COT-178 TaxID=2491047 RepID=UPI000F5EA9FF|nr:signal recognition particle protein [Fretibacterium sp. OH1220_COT-178]RRD65634.1 signal recognition particle protein [Fretibacterium sp. OH1220_COT-178]